MEAAVTLFKYDCRNALYYYRGWYDTFKTKILFTSLKFPQISKLVFGINVPNLCLEQNPSIKLFWGKLFKTCVSNMHIAFLYACLGYTVNNMKHIYLYIYLMSVYIYLYKNYRVSTYLNTNQIADYHIINPIIYRYHNKSSY